MDSNRDTSSEIDWSLPSQFSTIQPDLDDAEELFSSTTNTDQTGGIGPLQGPHSQGTEEGSVGLQHSAMLDTSNPLQVKTADALMNEAEQCTTNCLHSLEAVKQAAFQNATHGNFTEALRLYKKHIDIIQKIAADSPNNLREIARSLARVCLCNWELGENDQALLALFRIKNIGDQLYERGVVNWYLCITEEEGMVRVEIKLGRDHRRIVRRWLFISKPKRNIVGYKDDGDGLEMI